MKQSLYTLLMIVFWPFAFASIMMSLIVLSFIFLSMLVLVILGGVILGCFLFFPAYVIIRLYEEITDQKI